MAKFKLNISYEIDGENQIGEDEAENARHFAHIILCEQHIHGNCVPQVSMTREGDRSAANLLAPIPNSNHFKNTKISLNDYFAKLSLIHELSQD